MFKFDANQAAQLLNLAAHKSRLQALELLLQEEWDVSSLAKQVGLSQSALSQHLRKLRDSKVVTTRRKGSTIYYSCQSLEVAKLLEVIRILLLNAREH